MWRYLLLLLLAVLFVDAVPASSGEGIFASVQGKGTIVWESGATSEVRIAATRTSRGRISGTIEQINSGNERTLTKVTCVRSSQVPGSSAVDIGGVIVSSNARPTGEEITYVLADLGTGDGAPFDRIAIVVGLPDLATCPFDPDIIVSGHALAGGDFKVESRPRAPSPAADELVSRAPRALAAPHTMSPMQSPDASSSGSFSRLWLLGVGAIMIALVAAGLTLRRLERRPR
jgi:hypothetical protein